MAVLRAAEARLNLLRTIHPGPFEMARAGLIKRVEEARENVLSEIAANPQRPRADAAVAFAMPAPPSQRGALQPPVPPSQAVIPPAMPAVPPAMPGAAAPPPVPGGGYPGGGLETIAIRTNVYRKKTPVAGIVTTILALAAVAGGLVYYTYYGRQKVAAAGKAKPTEPSGKRQVASNDADHAGSSPKPAADEDAAARRNARKKEQAPIDPTSDRAVSTMKPPSREKPPVRPAPARKEPADEDRDDPIGAAVAQVAEPPPAPMRKPRAVEPAETAPDDENPAGQKPAGRKPAPNEPAEAMADKDGRLDATLSEVLEAMRQQEDDTVKRLLEEASKQARGDEPRQRVAAWQQLAAYYKGFLEYRKKALAAVKPGDEYDVKNQKVGVVEVDDDTFVYRAAGGNKTVPRDKIPAGIVLAIVMQWFDDNPANDLYVGAYHLAKPEPDPQRAREHWEKALAAGADSSALIPLLDDPVFAATE